MNKSTSFSGFPVIRQILSFIDKSAVSRTAVEHGSDRYVKKFSTWDHLATMIFSVVSGCSSLREVEGVILACEGKIEHLRLKAPPRRSTLSDANKRRSSRVFGKIYQTLYHQFKDVLSDSGRKPSVENLLIVDSTTISLFGNILKGAGRNPLNGQKKGGIKAHVMINALQDVPTLVNFSSAATHDHVFLKALDLQKGSFVVFDKAYVDYQQYDQWSQEGIFFVTRLKENAAYRSIEEFEVPENMKESVLKDEHIVLVRKDKSEFSVRRVVFFDQKKDKTYEFVTNHFELTPDKIADIYKNRWQIETMFKRLKQNFPLKYFLGESQNAIEIQIWVSLMVQLIVLVIQKSLKRKWAFSNMLSIIRYHLTSYIHLTKFLEDPDKSWKDVTTKPPDQPELFPN